MTRRDAIKAALCVALMPVMPDHRRLIVQVPPRSPMSYIPSLPPRNCWAMYGDTPPSLDRLPWDVTTFDGDPRVRIEIV